MQLSLTALNFFVTAQDEFSQPIPCFFRRDTLVASDVYTWKPLPILSAHIDCNISYVGRPPHIASNWSPICPISALAWVELREAFVGPVRQTERAYPEAHSDPQQTNKPPVNLFYSSLTLLTHPPSRLSTT